MTLEPAPILFRCPCCEATLSVPVEQAGVTGPCPHCSQLVRSPERSAGATGATPAMDATTDQEEGFSLKKLVPFENRLQWDAENKVWEQGRTMRVMRMDFWEGVASKIDSKKTGWAIAAVFVLFMGTVAYRDGYRSSGEADAGSPDRVSEFAMPEGHAGETGLEPAALLMPQEGFVSDMREISEP